ncbi:MAG: beta-propeller domain-containing protein [Marmoricola sp.]
MTDLEDAWNRYPTSAAPVAEIAAEGRRMRRVRAARPALGGLVAAAVAAVLVVALDTGGSSPTGGGTTALSPHQPVRLVAFQADLRPARSCAQLLNLYRQRGLRQVTAYGWNGGNMYAGLAEQRAPMGAAAVPDAQSTPIKGQASSSTGTNVQEVGVDEPDGVKTNGSLLVRIDGDTIAVYDVTGDSPKRVSTLAFPYFADGQILLAGTTLIALGSDREPSASQTPSARVVTVALADAAHPRITSSVSYDGVISSARQHGNTVRLVLTTGLPALAFAQADGSPGSQARALATNRGLVAHSTLRDWLPTVDSGSGARQLLDCGNVAVTPASVALGTTSVVGFQANAPTATSAIGITGQTAVAYESADHLYLTGAGTQMGFCACPRPLAAHVMGYGGVDRTAIFQFDLLGDQAAHVATGTVAGAIADRWSMDEAGGVLRIATTSVISDGSPTSSVVTLKPKGHSLVQLGRLDGLGVGETLTSARWFDRYAVLSTARQTDPLFTVDLGNLAHPKLLGALHIPGYSTYFHPLGNGLLLGVGQNVSFDSSGERTQAQVGLFDISDLSHVRRLAVTSLAQWTSPVAGSDPHAFTWLPDHDTALTSFTSQNGRILLGEFKVVLRTLGTKLISVPASDPSTVRTLELPDGRVVLMAGGSVSFLSL